MSIPDSNPAEQSLPELVIAPQQASPLLKLAQIISQDARFKGDAHGLDNGERAALARLDPDGELRPHQIAALSRALVHADLSPENSAKLAFQNHALPSC
mgnify:CR=1 FL=1